MNQHNLVGQKILLAFKGQTATPAIVAAIQKYRPAGVTLFRSLNIDDPVQLWSLTNSLQQVARDFDLPRLLIAADQEGGQLMAIGNGVTALPGNMALGATGSLELARKAGEVLGRELAALGVNVNYAPCCDVNNNPHNPVIGTRSFGENPNLVADLAAAMIGGIQSMGVAAVAKHFPGHGDTAADSHHGLPSLPHDLDRLQRTEFPPFQAAIDAGVKMVMSAHIALPAIDGLDAPPATLSPAILNGILRQKLGFDGVIVSDAMDMHAIPQGRELGEAAVRASAAGIDLLLLTSDSGDHSQVHASLLQALGSGSLEQGSVEKSVGRVLALKSWLAAAPPAPGLEVVGGTAHRQVASEIAERSITLVRDRASILPLSLHPDQRLGVVIPRPVDLTPADTSSYIKPGLAEAVRQYHPNTGEITVSYQPDDHAISDVLRQISNYDLVIFGTLNAFESPRAGGTCPAGTSQWGSNGRCRPSSPL